MDKEALGFLTVQVPQLLAQLEPTTPALWGKMNAQQMVEHLALTCRSSYKGLVKQSPTPENRQPVIKRLLLGNRPLAQGMHAPGLEPELFKQRHTDLAASIAELQLELSACLKAFQANPELQTIHPAMGLLTVDEWLVFHQKHFIHHFTQFGLIQDA